MLGVTPSNTEQDAFAQPGLIVVLTLIMLLSRFREIDDDYKYWQENPCTYALYAA
jgi:hypothetical protein